MIKDCENKQKDTCQICGNKEGNKHFSIQERMYNRNISFDYLLCKKCYTLQLTEEIPDISSYYPENYGGFKPVVLNQKTKKEQIINNLLSLLLLKVPYTSTLSQKVLDSKFYYLQCLLGQNISKKDKILDVGCGGGRWLDKLKEIGFSNLTGVDLYESEAKGNQKEWEFISGEIFDIQNRKFDVITLHHSFEHMKEPQKVLQKVNELLTENGICIIRIPLMGKYPWRKYKTNWVQIDAPRHFFLYHRKGMQMLVSGANFRIENIVYDSTDFQLWGSELYEKKELSLVEAQKNLSYVFPQKKLKEFKEKARTLNAKRDGDQAIFYLRRKG